MNPFQPHPISYQSFDPIDSEYARMITHWPGQVVCARIERIEWRELRVKEVEWKEF